jgi:hypothetical protein
MGKYSHMLNAVMEAPGALYRDPAQKSQEKTPAEPAGKK